jgi:hypothetical protein
MIDRRRRAGKLKPAPAGLGTEMTSDSDQTPSEVEQTISDADQSTSGADQSEYLVSTKPTGMRINALDSEDKSSTATEI